jgi:hypothetical protein
MPIPLSPRNKQRTQALSHVLRCSCNAKIAHAPEVCGWVFSLEAQFTPFGGDHTADAPNVGLVNGPQAIQQLLLDIPM